MAKRRKRKGETMVIISFGIIITAIAGLIFLFRNGFEALIDNVISAIIIGAVVSLVLEFGRRAGKLKISL